MDENSQNIYVYQNYSERANLFEIKAPATLESLIYQIKGSSSMSIDRLERLQKTLLIPKLIGSQFRVSR